MSSFGKSKTTRLKSKAWNYFDVFDSDSKSAVCKICRKTLSYRTSVSNLVKHYLKFHNNALCENSVDKSEISEDSTTSLSENEEESSKDDSKCYKTIKTLETKVYVEGKNEEESVCLLCQETFPVHDSTILMDHMFKAHNISQIKLVDGNIHLEQQEEPEEIIPTKKGKRSYTWDYFTIKDKEERIALCGLCNGELSYKSTVSNLLKHLNRKHHVTYKSNKDGNTTDSGERIHNVVSASPRQKTRSGIWAFFNFVNEEKTICFCLHCNKEFSIIGGGVRNMKKHLMVKHPEVLLHHDTIGDPLFVSTTNEDENDESEDESLQAEYLESDEFDEQEIVKRSTSYTRTNACERKPKRNRIFKTPDFTQSSSEVPTTAKVPHSLEHFSNYITSLLQELPEKVSKKLQMNFVKQIIEAQITCADNDNAKEETVTAVNSTFTESLSDGDISITNERSASDSTATSSNTVNTGGVVTIANGIIIRPIISTSNHSDLSEIK